MVLLADRRRGVTRYALVTRWHLDAPIERVWETLVAVEEWPRWWRCVRSVAEIEPGDAAGVGTLRRFVWSGMLPYRLTFDIRTTAVSPPTLIEGIANGEIDGLGRCRIEALGPTTRIQYDWSVSLAKRWMVLLEPLLAPAFRWNHDQVMAEGGRALARHLGVRLLAYERLPRRDKVSPKKIG